MLTYALHGFLGLPRDWQAFPMLTPVNLWAESILPLWGWARRFNESHSGHLVGYSMGGRLALHALIDNPANWRSAVIVSAHPGLGDPTERLAATGLISSRLSGCDRRPCKVCSSSIAVAMNSSQTLQILGLAPKVLDEIKPMVRLAQDEEWALRFESAPWREVIQQWNQQPIFSYDIPVQRDVSDYDRKKLAQALRLWSLGRQDNLSPMIAQLPIPILWVVGAKDTKYVEVGKSLSFAHPLSRIEVVANAGHRVPWHQPDRFKRLIEEWNNDCNVYETVDSHRTISRH